MKFDFGFQRFLGAQRVRERGWRNKESGKERWPNAYFFIVIISEEFDLLISKFTNKTCQKDDEKTGGQMTGLQRRSDSSTTWQKTAIKNG